MYFPTGANAKSPCGLLRIGQGLVVFQGCILSPTVVKDELEFHRLLRVGNQVAALPEIAGGFAGERREGKAENIAM